MLKCRFYVGYPIVLSLLLLQSIDTKIGDRFQSLEFLKIRLLQEEQRMSERVKQEVNIDSALIGKYSQRRNIFCYHYNICKRPHV